MSAQLIKERQVGLLMIVTVMAIGSLFVVRTAFARIVNNTIDPVAIVADHGRHLIVTGPIACTANERAYLEIAVTQRATGAVAEGRTRFTCSGAIEQWEIHASTRGNEAFREGPATAVVLARTVDRGDTTDAQQWLVAIALVSE